MAANLSLTTGQVAAITGRSRRAVIAARERLRSGQVSAPERPQHGRRWTQADHAVAVDPALSVEQAATRLGRTVMAVQEIRRRHQARQLRERVHRRSW
ncbi:hypothetical protein [Mycobacteroides chelonae]|uniref:hypothetical protein n=1 Tax=Mycobacteroides chelonae TaxID=1774 RepID=UPI001C2C5074|nr:hypothetical protein [Mycobacteroides chelonae]MBV0917955.1 hypothetical protein [Mycobacteroides chelonae]